MPQTSDVLIIGGGVIGFAIALELRQQGAEVTLISRDSQQAASRAAAGMLAPHAEGIPPGAFWELCDRSLTRYPEWIAKLEALSGYSTGYWPCGILAPHYLATCPPSAIPTRAGTDTSGQWLQAATISHYQAGLSSEVAGGWWFADDGQVDNRALMQALQMAVQDLGVTVQEGVAVDALQICQGQVHHLQTSQGIMEAQHYVLAAGAWSSDLLPVPVVPRKGQMSSVRVPPGWPDPQPLKHVLYGTDVYLVPRRDGRILIGATSEAVGFTPANTPAGLQQLFAQAIRLYPCLKEFPIVESWWGFRPATPDEMPILGASPYGNLTLATGHYRNGILLAPITAQLIASSLCQSPDPLLETFSWQRFQQATPSVPADSSASTGPMVPLAASPAQPLSSPLSFSAATMPTLDRTAAPDLPLVEGVPTDTPLVIAGRSFRSRLMTGTGKYDSFEVMRQSIAASGCEIVTVAVRRVQTHAPGHEGLAEALDWSQIWMLPNTAGCQTAEEAIRVARLGREMAKLLGQEDNNFVKLEVIPDPTYLLPDPIGTLQAAEQLVKEGFAVLPYINADPLLAKRLEEVGCATVMPLGSPIGSGQGIRNAANIQIIIETIQVPVVVDAGIGTPSEAAQAMEMGADALLINTAIAKAQNPIAMGRAMGLAAEAGRLAYVSGRIPVKAYASASSPLTGLVSS